MKKVGISTIYTGYNYGSALQAYATREILRSLGFEGEILKLSGSIVEGRDIRVNKLTVMALRSIIHYKAGKQSAQSYRANYRTELSEKTKRLFSNFYSNNIRPTVISYSELKRKAHNDEFYAFLCGSDQIWNASSLYVDPFYYLEFAPRNKRIAFAPSFGRNEIPKYNRSIIYKRIRKIPHLSVRENEGQRIIFNGTGRKARVLIDPTLVLSKQEWIESLDIEPYNKDYVLAYFLDEPSNLAKMHLKREIENGEKIICIPRRAIAGTMVLDAGPKEFLRLILSAKRVYTDSFHGTAFSISFHKDFYSYSRNYGAASDQSSRLISLLDKLDLIERYDPQGKCLIDYSLVDQLLEKERKASKRYLQKCLNKV
ncbi:MAG: polysaccharide pyruvyl transferase family protein [Ruminococcus sp.]|nr:polysaccharide pyruvyl transferase family protein [Ruminococcus sp.]